LSSLRTGWNSLYIEPIDRLTYDDRSNGRRMFGRVLHNDALKTLAFLTFQIQ